MRYFILKTFTDDEAETCKRCNMPELVKCKDCRWGEWSRNAKGEDMIFCYNGDTGIEDGYLHEPDWFCADGERKQE